MTRIAARRSRFKVRACRDRQGKRVLPQLRAGAGGVPAIPDRLAVVEEALAAAAASGEVVLEEVALVAEVSAASVAAAVGSAAGASWTFQIRG